MSGNALWISPNESETTAVLTSSSPDTNGVELAMFFADGSERARCVAFVNHRWQAHHRSRSGFIGYFAAPPRSSDAVSRVLDAAEEWLAARGADTALVGYNGVCGSSFGIRTAEFDRPPLFPEPWNPPYYSGDLERHGYERCLPWVSTRTDLEDPRAKRIGEVVVSRALCTVRPFDIRVRRDLDAVIKLSNEGFEHAWDFYPITEEELRAEYEAFGVMADRNFALLAEVDGIPAGLCIGTPDYSALIRRLDGRNGLFRKWRFMAAARRATLALPNTLAVLEEHRGRHIAHTLMATLFANCRRRGIRSVEGLQVDARNTRMLSVLNSFGSQQVIRYHHFRKALD